MTGGQPNSTPAAAAELGSHGSADRAPDRSVDSQDTDKALLAPATRSSDPIMTSDQAARGGSGEIPPSPLPPSPGRSSSSLSVTAGRGISMEVTTWITSRKRMESANQPIACSVSPRRHHWPGLHALRPAMPTSKGNGPGRRRDRVRQAGSQRCARFPAEPEAVAGDREAGSWRRFHCINASESVAPDHPTKCSSGYRLESCLAGAGGTRTHDLRFRKPSLYPGWLNVIMGFESRRGDRDRTPSSCRLRKVRAPDGRLATTPSAGDVRRVPQKHTADGGSPAQARVR